MTSRRGPMPRTRKREAKNAIAALHSLNWMIRPEALRQMMEIAARENVITEALEAKLGAPANEDGLMTIRDGVATLFVEGPLFRYANLFTRISGATSYATLATDLEQALAMPQVRSILLAIDSPGGEVNGCAEFADMVFAARGRKPIAAYISGDGCSAAYWIASAADEIVISQTALVGCIGTVASLVDDTAADEMMGIRRIDVVSSQTPKKRFPPLSGEKQAQVQTMVDELAQVFIDSLSQNRGVGADVILAQYGEGGVFVGESAVAAGLADRLGSYESLHAELASGTHVPRSSEPIPTSKVQEPGMEDDQSTSARAAASKKGATASADATPAADAAAACTCGHAQDQHADNTGPCNVDGCGCQEYKAETPAAAPDPAGPADAPASEAETAAARTDAAAEEGARLERERISSIESLGRPGQEKLVAECVRDPKCTPEMAAFKLLKADGAARGAQLRKLAGDDTNLEAPGPVGPGSSEGNSTGAAVRRIVAAHEKATTSNRSK